MALTIPLELAASCQKTPERSAWLDRLPNLVREIHNRWALTPDGVLDGDEPTCSFVAPVLLQDGTQAVLKTAMPHMEGEDEIHGLRFWNGEPTVRLIAADHELGAMLLERCQPGTTLRSLPEGDQDVIISGLLKRLWCVPSSPHPFRSLSTLLEYWRSETLTQIEHWPDAGLVEEGFQVLKQLQATTPRIVLLATDLHAGNVLKAAREPWLVIDPKPFLGDPAYDATQHLFNCPARLQLDPDGTMQSFADLLGVEHERVRLWTFARAAAGPRDDWKNSRRFALARAIAP